MSTFKANFVTVTVQYEYFNIKKTSLQLTTVARSIYITLDPYILTESQKVME